MLIKHKYTSKSIDELINKKLLIYKNYFNINTINNIILYGKNGSGKYTFAKCILYKLFGKDIYKTKKIILKLEDKNLKDISIIASSYHYEIYLNDYLLNNKKSLISIIRELCETKNINNDNYKFILIKNADFICKETLIKIKNISETYYSTCKFIFTTNSTSILSKYLKGLFEFIRVPCPSIDEIKQYLKDICFLEKIIYDDKIIEYLIEKSGKNMNVLMYLFEMSYPNKEYKPQENIINIKLDKLIKHINSKKIENILIIRKELYDILANNINKIYIYKYIVNSYLYQDISHNHKAKIVEAAATFQHRSCDAYRETIHLEGFLIKIMDILVN